MGHVDIKKNKKIETKLGDRDVASLRSNTGHVTIIQRFGEAGLLAW